MDLQKAPTRGPVAIFTEGGLDEVVASEDVVEDPSLAPSVELLLGIVGDVVVGDDAMTPSVKV